MVELNRRNILQVAVATCLAFGAGVTAHAADPSGKVTYWHHFRSQEEFKGLQRVMELFKRLYPKVDLVQEDIPAPAYMTKFTARWCGFSPVGSIEKWRNSATNDSCHPLCVASTAGVAGEYAGLFQDLLSKVDVPRLRHGQHSEKGHR